MQHLIVALKISRVPELRKLTCWQPAAFSLSRLARGLQAMQPATWQNVAYTLVISAERRNARKRQSKLIICSMLTENLSPKSHGCIIDAKL
jgi:hypothetical protein